LVKLEFDFLVSDYSFQPAVEEDLGTIAYTARTERQTSRSNHRRPKDVAVEAGLFDSTERTTEAWRIGPWAPCHGAAV
jgi:hypothetical protein